MTKYSIYLFAILLGCTIYGCNLIVGSNVCPPDNFFTATVNISATLNDPIPNNTAPYSDTPLVNIPFAIRVEKCGFNAGTQFDTIFTDNMGQKTIIYKDLKEAFCEGTNCTPRILVSQLTTTNKYVYWDSNLTDSKTVKSLNYIYKRKSVLALQIKRDTADVGELFLSASQSQFGRLKIVNPTITIFNRRPIDTVLYFNMAKNIEVNFYILFDNRFIRQDTIKPLLGDTVRHLLRL